MEKISRILPPSRRTQTMDNQIRNNLRPGAPNFIGKSSVGSLNSVATANLGPALERPDAQTPQFNESADNSGEVLEGVFGTDPKRFPTDRISFSRPRMKSENQEAISSPEKNIDNQKIPFQLNGTKENAVKAEENELDKTAELKQNISRAMNPLKNEEKFQGSEDAKKSVQDSPSYERMKEMRQRKAAEDITKKFSATSPAHTKKLIRDDDEMKSEKFAQDVERKSVMNKPS